MRHSFSSDFCEDVLLKLRLSDWELSLLFSRYVEHKSDKEIAKSLEKAYDSLKTIEHEVLTK